mgnify:CR=1 FL=1
MAHMLDNTGGVHHMGSVKTPWHGLGHRVDPNASPEEWRRKCIPWEVYKVPTLTKSMGSDGRFIDQSNEGMFNLIRGDNGKALSAVSDRYHVHTIESLMQIMKRLCELHDFQMETIGSLDGGKKVWALAKIAENYQLIDEEVAPYVLLSTSYDKSTQTPARLTEVCVVCNNTLQWAEKSRPDLSISHKKELNPTEFVDSLAVIKSDHIAFKDLASNLVETTLSGWKISELIIKVASNGKENAVNDYARMSEDYHREQLDPSEAATFRAVTRVKNQLIAAMANSNGHDLKARDMTPWGVIQGVTNVVDFQSKVLLPKSTRENLVTSIEIETKERNNRLSKSWFGTGQSLKETAVREATKYLKAA